MGHSQFDALKPTFTVDNLTYTTSSLALVFPYMFAPKQKLSVEIADLDIVVVSN